MTAQRVVIVGCGIAGPVVAMFLRRLGIDAVIHEARARDGRSEGAFLGVAPNGMNVLAELGVAAEIERVAAPCHAFAFQNADGRAVGAIDRRQDAERFGARLQMVRRGDLHAVLTDAALKRGVQVHFESALTGIDRSDPRIVTATFSAGDVERADALIGCDGINSRTRAIVLPASPAPDYSGLLDFGGFARCSPADLEAGVNVMVFGRRAFFGAFRTPDTGDGRGEVWWFHNSGEKSPQSLVRDPAAARARILDLHRDDPGWIRDVVNATPDVLGPFALHDILTMPRWYDGRVCLVGDAAHATTPSGGQGASMAMEDAMVLAQCLRDAAGPPAAFAAFERARRARVEEVVKLSRRNGSGKAVSGPVAEWFRDRLLPLFLKLGAKAQDRAYAHRILWERSAIA